METNLQLLQSMELALSKLLQLLALAILMVTGTITAAQAQQVPGTNDPSFNTADVIVSPDGFNGQVTSIALQPDGKVVMAGGFYMYNGTSRGRIARLNADGSLDASFNPGTGFDVIAQTLALQTDGKVVVGGWFNSFNGISRNRIARLNTDGCLDTSFDPGTGFNSYVSALAVQADGKFIVSGGFTTYNGTSVNTLVRLNTDGSLDYSFNQGAGFSGNVMAVALQSDGKIFVSGVFASFNGISRNGIVRLNADGSLDTTFEPGTGFNGNVRTITLQGDGKVVAGGSFSSFNGSARSSIARLNVNGSLDETFNPGTGFNIVTGPMALPVQAISVQPDGKIVVGGNFSSYNGAVRNRIIRLNADGAPDESFQAGTGAVWGVNDAVQSIALQPNGLLVVGGSFTSSFGAVRGNIARLYANGMPDTSFNPVTGFNSNVISIVLQSDGKAVVGGFFTSYNGIVRNFITRLNVDGSLDESFNPGSGLNHYVYSIALQGDGKIVVGGRFSAYHGTKRNGILRLNTDGSLDESFNPGTGIDGGVSAIALQPDGKVLVGGQFTSYNGIARNRIARLNADGSLDNSFNPGTGFNFNTFGGSVETIVLQTDGKMIVGGAFNNFNGAAINFITRLNTDGSLDESFNTGTGLNSTVHTLMLQSDGKVVVGGNFTTYNGTPYNRIVRLNVDGSLDTSFDPGTGFNSVVLSIATQSDGKVVAGGNFSSYNGTARNRIARLDADGSLDATFNPGTGFNNTVGAIALQTDGKVVVGGSFTSFDNIVRNRIARLHGGEGPVLSAAKAHQPGLDVLLYPNPTQGEINLILSGTKALVGAVKLTLYDAMGREVLSKEVTAAEAQAGVQLSTAGHALGVCFLRISSRSGVVTKRLVLAE